MTEEPAPLSNTRLQSRPAFLARPDSARAPATKLPPAQGLPSRGVGAQPGRLQGGLPSPPHLSRCPGCPNKREAPKGAQAGSSGHPPVPRLSPQSRGATWRGPAQSLVVASPPGPLPGGLGVCPLLHHALCPPCLVSVTVPPGPSTCAPAPGAPASGPTTSAPQGREAAMRPGHPQPDSALVPSIWEVSPTRRRGQSVTAQGA